MHISRDSEHHSLLLRPQSHASLLFFSNALTTAPVNVDSITLAPSVAIVLPDYRARSLERRDYRKRGNNLLSRSRQNSFPDKDVFLWFGTAMVPSAHRLAGILIAVEAALNPVELQRLLWSHQCCGYGSESKKQEELVVGE